MNEPVVTGVRVTQEAASVSDVEAASRVDPTDRVTELLENEAVREAFVLQTCIRCERYVVTDDHATGRAVLADGSLDGGVAPTWMDHEAAVRHLCRVAAGLESFVTGEDAILGQVREAYRTAKSVGGLDAVLEPAILTALHLGERARTETAINEGPTSIGGAAVALAARAVDLPTARALVVGAGEMGTYAAQALSIRDVDELILVNRTRQRADHLAAMLESQTTVSALDALPSLLADVDVVVSATARPDFVLTASMVDPGTDLVVVDVAQPRDVDPATGRQPGVTVYDLEDLESVTETARSQRRDATRRVESMVDEAVARLQERDRTRRIEAVIAAMYEGAERVKREEVETAIAKLESRSSLTDRQREDIEAMADALVSRLLATPTASLRAAAASDDWDRVDAALDLFGRERDDSAGTIDTDPTLFADANGRDGPEPATGREDDSTSR